MNKQLINRTLASSFSDVFSVLPVITLTGPRQSGKTTLCREMFPELPYVSLEDADTLAEVQADPKAFFNRFPSGVIIDEAHHFPTIFSYIQVIVDEDRFHSCFSTATRASARWTCYAYCRRTWWRLTKSNRHRRGLPISLPT